MPVMKTFSLGSGALLDRYLRRVHTIAETRWTTATPRRT